MFCLFCADTSTVYEKGAEVIGLYRTLLGEGGFKRGMKLYFERHDGHAVTCDDFRAAMAGTVCVEAMGVVACGQCVEVGFVFDGR
jgi:hypothetical protein